MSLRDKDQTPDLCRYRWEKPPAPDAVGVRALEGRRTEATGLASFQGWKSFGANVPAVSPPANIRSASGAEEHFLECHSYLLPARDAEPRPSRSKTTRITSSNEAGLVMQKSALELTPAGISSRL